MGIHLSRRNNPYNLFVILILERVCDEQEENSIRLADRLPTLFPINFAILH